MLKIILILILSYILGSIPNALWIGKLFKNVDVRKFGSGNIGSTNAARVLGYKYGIMTLVLDVLKGAIPTYIGYSISSDLGILAGLLAVVGHTYSIFVKFQGGKAVATTIGVFLIISPYSILTLLGLFIIIVLISGYVSLASIICASLLFVAVYIYHGTIHEVIFALLIGILVIYRHKSNIKNLLEKKEAKFFDKIKK